MRLRYIEGQYDYVKDHPKGIVEPQNYDDIRAKFTNNNPIHVELGCGKGRFIRGMAAANPDINFLGFEKSIKVAYRCLKCSSSAIDEELKNYYIVYSNGDILSEIFPEKSIERIYLNFSDPWPKPGHYKRRLTHKGFLDNYKKVLVDKGEIHMKTDNNDLFEYSIEQLTEDGWDLILITRDLHNSEYVNGNIMTEYEEKFSESGKKINKLIARKK